MPAETPYEKAVRVEDAMLRYLADLVMQRRDPFPTSKATRKLLESADKPPATTKKK
jgi:hypothetical protein